MKENLKNKSQQLKNIYRLFDEEKWPEARKSLFNLLKAEPDDHWLLTRISTTYYQEKKYSKALEYSEQALKIMPRCPLVLWDYAGTLDMLGRSQEALQIFKSLTKEGINRIAYGVCGEGIIKARSLVNDCYYQIGLIYADMDKLSLAKRYINFYIAGRGQGYISVFNLRDVKKKLLIIQEGKNAKIENPI